MIDHITINVSDYNKSKTFYKEAFEACNYKLLAEFSESDSHYAGFGIERPIFWISSSDQAHPTSINTHIALQVNSAEEVHQFHQAALKAGGKDNGGPGPRPIYGPEYYAAFILDPDNNNIEVLVKR